MACSYVTSCINNICYGELGRPDDMVYTGVILLSVSARLNI